MKIKSPRYPATLKAPGRTFWKKVCGDFEISDEHTLRLLEQACGCLDRIEQAREAIEKTGLTFEDRFGQRRMTPEVLIERDMRSLFMRLIRELGFDLPATESRPPRRYS